MSCDRFVYWDKKKPTKEEVRIVCEDYLKGVGTVEKDKNGVVCKILGTLSAPLNRIEGAYKTPAPEAGHDERWIEVFVAKTNIDVITRQQDELTNNIADGLAKLFARFWQGRLEDD